jgi:predicted nucleic acid-binding protein
MFDTSGLVKYYYTEVGSIKVVQVIDDLRNRIFISELSIVELVSTLAKKVRTGDISLRIFRATRRRFFADIATQKFNTVMLMQKHGSIAVKLLVKHATKRALRTLDALQLAVATDLKGQSNLDYFVCADDKLDKVAKLEKITFLNPEKP